MAQRHTAAVYFSRINEELLTDLQYIDHDGCVSRKRNNIRRQIIAVLNSNFYVVYGFYPTV